MKNWYIVQSHSSFENKVAVLIKEEAEKLKISDKIEEIVVPTHDITEVKRGKRIQRKKKYFPGYVLIKSEMDNNIYHMIKNIKRVSGFLGSKGVPIPVLDKEIEKILGQIKDGVAQPKSGIEYAIGEKVQVIDGPFASFHGMVEEVENLINNGLSINRLNYFGLEYKFIGKYLNNELSYDDMVEKLNIAINQFSKRQMTFFRRMEKRGIDIKWIEINNYNQAYSLTKLHF